VSSVKLEELQVYSSRLQKELVIYSNSLLSSLLFCSNSVLLLLLLGIRTNGSDNLVANLKYKYELRASLSQVKCRDINSKTPSVECRVSQESDFTDVVEFEVSNNMQ
jgi:hypothetical protein